MSWVGVLRGVFSKRTETTGSRSDKTGIQSEKPSTPTTIHSLYDDNGKLLGRGYYIGEYKTGKFAARLYKDANADDRYLAQVFSQCEDGGWKRSYFESGCWNGMRQKSGINGEAFKALLNKNYQDFTYLDLDNIERSS